MNFSKLASDLLRLRQSNKNISINSYPESFYFESELNQEFDRIENFSNKESMLFAKNQGSVGNEYALQLIYFIDEIYTSKAFSGTSNHVVISNKISAHPQYSENNTKVSFDLTIGEKAIKTKKYTTGDTEEGLFGIVAIIHTHPKYYIEKGSSLYSFFSSQDISTVVYGSIPVTGLIAGRKIWIAAKTSESKMIPNELLQKASQLEYTDGVESVKKFVKENLKEYGIVFYFGTLRGNLERV